MNAIKQLLVNLMYICFALTIIAVLYLSYLFMTSVSSTDMNYFAEEQKENFAIFLEEAKVHIANSKEILAEKTAEFIIFTEYYIGQLEYTTANMHTDIVKNHKIVQLMKNPPPVVIEEIPSENSKFTSDVFLSTQGENRVVYYNQTVEPWRSIEYGPNNTIGKYGCGPTAMSMVLSTFLQEDITPAMAAQWAYAHGYFAHNSGSYHSLIPEMAEAFGLVSTSLKKPTLDDLLYELDKGNLIVVLLGKGTFADAGHFVVLRDRSEAGEIYMADSQSLKISQQAWDGNLILNDAKYYANSGGPFWSISTTENIAKQEEEVPEDELFIEGLIEVVDSTEDIDSTSEPVAESNSESITEPVTESTTESESEPITESNSELNDAPIISDTTNIETVFDIIKEDTSNTENNENNNLEDIIRSINDLNNEPIF